MEDLFEILPTKNDMVNLVINKKYNFEMMVYYAEKIPSEIPDKFVFAFGFIDRPRPSGGQGIIAIFAIPEHEKLILDKRIRHAIVKNAMHHYLTQEWNLFWFDKVSYSNGYMLHIFDEETEKEHVKYLARVESEIDLKFHEWKNKHLMN